MGKPQRGLGHHRTLGSCRKDASSTIASYSNQAFEVEEALLPLDDETALRLSVPSLVLMFLSASSLFSSSTSSMMDALWFERFDVDVNADSLSTVSTCFTAVEARGAGHFGHGKRKTSRIDIRWRT